jgi:transposase-like protein
LIVDDKVKIRCPACTRVFHEKAGRVRDGFQVNCANCNRLLTLTKETEDPFLRRALKAAKELRAAKDAELYVATYAGAASTPKRETP